MNQRPAPTQFDRGTPTETLAGTIERVTFHNAETGFCVLKVQARGKRDLVPVIGHAPAIAAGEWITATGIWFTDRQGLQFKADTLKAMPPTGVEGFERYLASGYMRGIGPAMAKRIVALFGEATFEIIEADPDRLKEVSGIGPTRAARIVSGWAEQKAVREIMIFLHAHGVGTARAVRIFKTYGHEATRGRIARCPHLELRTPSPLVDETGTRRHDAAAAEEGVAEADHHSPSRVLSPLVEHRGRVRRLDTPEQNQAMRMPTEVAERTG